MRYIKRNLKDDLDEEAYCESLLSESKVNEDDLHKDDRIRMYLVKVYGLKCCYCENVLDSSAQVQVDHFYPQKVAKGKANPQKDKYVYDIRNFHISCWRCNRLKGMYDGDPSSSYYKGPALSPNYYQDGGKWKLTKEDYLEKHIKFLGPVLKSDQYKLFFDKLQINVKSLGEEMGTHLSSIHDRARYLYETQELLTLCNDIIQYDKKIACKILKFISNRFNEKAKYSTMIIQNLGKAYLNLKDEIEGQSP